MCTAGLIAVLFACKVEVEPTVYITVVDSANAPVNGAWVNTHPCLNTEDCDTARVNPAFVQTDSTNALGQVVFKYPYSAIIDVKAGKYDETIERDLVGQTVARFETKRLEKGNENLYNVIVTLQTVDP